MVSKEVFEKYKILSQKLAYEGIIALIDDTHKPADKLPSYSVMYCKSTIEGKGGIWYRTLTNKSEEIALDAFLLSDIVLEWAMSKIEKDLQEKNIRF